MFYGVPRYQKAFLNELVEIGVGEEDMQVCDYPTDLQVSQKVLILVNFAIVIELLFPPYYIISSINSLKDQYYHLSSNNVTFGCLETNCTSKNHQNQLISLPVFSLCKQDYQWLYTPILFKQFDGLIWHCAFTFYIFIVNVLTTYYMYYRPVDSDMHLFSYLPVASIRYKCEDMRRSLAKVYVSMINLHNESPQELYVVGQIDEDSDKRRTTNRKSVCDFDKKLVDIYNEQIRMCKFNKRYVDLDKDTRDYIEDCLTVFRSAWWHPKCVRSMFIGHLFFFGWFVFFTLVAIILINQTLENETGRLVSILRDFKLNGCSLQIGSEHALTEFDIVSSSTHWSTFASLIVAVCTVPGLCLFAIAWSWSQQTTFDMMSMISEQMDRVSMALEITSELRATGLHRTQSNIDMSNNGYNHTITHTFDRLKNLHMKSLRVSRPFSILEPSKCSTIGRTAASDPRQIGLELVRSDGFNISCYQELLTKLYVNNGSLMSAFVKFNQNFESMFLVMFVLSYGAVAMIIYLNKKFDTLNYESLVLGLIGVALIGAAVLLPSKAHSHSKGLVILMWRLMVASMDFEDIRVRHLRLLMLKQLMAICNDGDGGLSYRAFGVPLTYGFLIKLALSSATIIVVFFQ